MFPTSSFPYVLISMRTGKNMGECSFILGNDTKGAFRTFLGPPTIVATSSVSSSNFQCFAGRTLISLTVIIPKARASVYSTEAAYYQGTCPPGSSPFLLLIFRQGTSNNGDSEEQEVNDDLLRFSPSNTTHGYPRLVTRPSRLALVRVHDLPQM